MEFIRRSIAFGLFAIGLFASLAAQVFGTGIPDNWYDENQRYFVFFVDQEGIYRLTYEELAKAGVPVDLIKPERYRLFSYGIEQNLLISSQEQFQAKDYLEFYGRNNDGTLDAILYADPVHHPLNPKLSFYGNKRPYYLTWDKSPDKLPAPRRYIKKDNGLGGQGLPPKESIYLHKRDTIFTSFHFKPTHDGRNYIRYSNFDVAEGYGSELTNETNLYFQLEDFVSNTLDVRVKLRFGTNVLSRNHSVYINDFAIKNISQTGYGVVEVNEKINRQLITSHNLKLTIRGLTGSQDKHSLAFAEIWYPRKYDFKGQSTFFFHQQPSIISRLVEIENFDVKSGQVRLFNLDKGYYMHCETQDDLVRFVSPSSFTEDRLILTTDQAVLTINSIEEVRLNKQLNDVDYMIITHPRLIQGGAEEYEKYRQSPEGGGYRTAIVDMDLIYHAFGYGVKGHPASLVNYFKALDREEKMPDFIFLLGKGLEYSEFHDGDTDQSFVPTMGIPGSDNLLVRGMDGKFPAAPVGRLAASNTDDIINYLEKIKLHENPVNESQTLSDQGWKKSLIHLSGGSADIQDLLFSFLRDMEHIVSNNKFGGEVTTFRKTSADPIQQTKTQAIIERMNEGAAMVTFFGHSAVGTFDFSLEDPSKYDNKGKNPVILSLGCHSGNIHTPFPGVSEDFVLEKENGAIAFVASSGTAFPGPQYRLGSALYEFLGGEMYGEPIGRILQRVISEQSQSTSIEVQTLAQQFTLHGDPAYRQHGFSGSDYIIDPATVRIEPDLLNSTVQQFDVVFDVVNIGAATTEEVDVRAIHVLPNGTATDTFLLTIPSPANRTNVAIAFNNPGLSAIGINKVLLELDPFNLIAEKPGDLAETNNRLINATGEEGHRFFILDNSARPMYPPDFSIVPEAGEIKLSSAISNALSPGGTFIVQIDTTNQFNSPLLQTAELESTSSIISWAPDLNWTPGTVYYWRIRPEDNDVFNLNNHLWRTSSFIYLPGSEKGWSQSHHYQWLANEYRKMSVNDQRKLAYDLRSWDVRIKNEIGDPSDFWVFVNNTPWASLNPKELAPAIAVFAWDKKNGIVQNHGSDYGSIPYSKDGFVFKANTPSGRKGLIELLNALQDGTRVFIHTILGSDDDDLQTKDWKSDKEILGSDLFDVLTGFGAKKVKMLETRGTVPYTFIFDKGEGPVVEDLAGSIYETLDLNSTAKSIWDEGEMTSVQFGPSNRWMRLKWEEEKTEGDQTLLQVYGVKPTGKIDLLKEIRNDYDVNLTSINPEKYPYLRLKYVTEDEKHKTSAQLSHWRIVHTTLPDAALYSDVKDFAIADTINAGEELSIKFQLRHLTPAPMEAPLVRFRLTGKDNQEAVFVRRVNRLPGNGAIVVEENVPTQDLEGVYRIEIEINPGQEIREVTDCNNFGYTEVFIRPDKENPLLDVTFDGRHIRNGQYIRSHPEIVVTLYDANQHVLLTDPELLAIKLIYPGGLEWKIKIGDPGVQFIPAKDPSNNIAYFVLTPNLNAPGNYALEVQARDVAGNSSGKEKFRVTFRIGDYNEDAPFRIYPNPTRNHAQIEYFLNADRLPDIFIFRIISSDGVVINSFGPSEFGGIGPGLNSFVWDATDNSGSPLPAGIYFYELITDIGSKRDKIKGSIILLR